MLRRIPWNLSRGLPTTTKATLWSRPASTKANAAEQYDEAEIDSARKWLADFDPQTIPKNICDISFSRSSGPGGQNVNKVNSKATLRVPTADLLRLMPTIFHRAVLSSRYHAASSNTIIVQADGSRKQADNVQECFRKLHHMIQDVGKEVVPGETTAAQKKKVKSLQSAETEARLRLKKKHSSVKSARKGRGGKEDY